MEVVSGRMSQGSSLRMHRSLGTVGKGGRSIRMFGGRIIRRVVVVMMVVVVWSNTGSDSVSGHDFGLVLVLILVRSRECGVVSVGGGCMGGSVP